MNATISIQREYEADWESLHNKSGWVNEMLQAQRDAGSNPQTDVELSPTVQFPKKTAYTSCKHGFDPKFCKFARNGKFCK